MIFFKKRASKSKEFAEGYLKAFLQRHGIRGEFDMQRLTMVQKDILMALLFEEIKGLKAYIENANDLTRLQIEREIEPMVSFLPRLKQRKPDTS